MFNWLWKRRDRFFLFYALIKNHLSFVILLIFSAILYFRASEENIITVKRIEYPLND